MKTYPCYVVAERLIKFSPSLMWRAEFVSDEFGNITKEISKQSPEAGA